MPIYKITYTEVWSNDFHVEARTKEEADDIFTTAIDRDIIHPGDDCYFDSSDWTTEEALDAPDRYIDVSYRDFEPPKMSPVDSLLHDESFNRRGKNLIAQSVAPDLVTPLWESVKQRVAQEIVERPTLQKCDDTALRRAIGNAMVLSATLR